MSSIWTTIHGHCHPHIIEAIARQARELDHATALGATNPVAESLAERLCALTGLSRAFFSSDGASAVEAAVKIAVQFWQNVGEPQRRRFMHLRSSYHGDTTGAMSLSDIAVFRERFAPLCFETLAYDAVKGDTAELERMIRRPDVAAIVVEPLVQAAAGMRILPPEAYRPLQTMPEKTAPHPPPLLILDEIATGFGRTGTLFAFEQLSLRPDLLCLGKGISGGTLALSATLASEHVFESFLSPLPSDLRHFFHGHSYASNPIACAAALASLELFETEGTLARVTRLTQHLERLAVQLRASPRVREVRHAGLMCGIELESDAAEARSLADALYARGHFTRPIGNVMQLVPPLSSAPEDLEHFFEALADALWSSR